jgi:hypothetical protein
MWPTMHGMNLQLHQFEHQIKRGFHLLESDKNFGSVAHNFFFLLQGIFVIQNYWVSWLCLSFGILVSRIQSYRTMDKVQKPSNSEYYTPSSEPFRIFVVIFTFSLYDIFISLFCSLHNFLHITCSYCPVWKLLFFSDDTDFDSGFDLWNLGMDDWASVE